jgi:hemerythrin
MHVKFTKDLLTGHELIDNQHKEIFARLETFWQAAREGKGKDEVCSALSFLREYVITHFAEEEKFQIQNAYPDYEKHKFQHDNFKVQVNDLVKRIQKGGANYSIAVDTLNLMLEWVITHIKDSDKKVVLFSRAKSNPVSLKA